MSLIGLFSISGSPGTTCLATALAAQGRNRGAVLVEADPAGGELALTLGISQMPGLVQFAARINARREAEVFDGVVRTVGRPAYDLVPAPIESPVTAAALDALADDPAALIRVIGDRPVLLDFGRLDPRSPAYRLVEACQARVLVVRGDLAALGRAQQARRNGNVPARTGFALIDSGPYRARETADVLELPCLATVPFGRRPTATRHARRAIDALWSGLDEFTQRADLAHANRVEVGKP